jgi:hypothetical protein
MHREGALVLSEFTRAATELREAFMRNPFDIDGTHRVIERVLVTDREDRRRRISAHGTPGPSCSHPPVGSRRTRIHPLRKGDTAP